MLAVGVALTVGSRRYDQHCAALRLRRARLPALDRLEMLLPAGVTFDAAAGEDVSLELDGGDGAATVFTGRLSEVRRGLDGLRLTAHNGGLALARYRPTLALEQSTAGEVIASLCGDAGVDLGEHADGPALALYAADGRSTALQEIARLALLAGAGAGFDGDGRLHVTEDGGPGGERAMRYGRELLEVELGQGLEDEAGLTVVGEGGGKPSSPEGRWVIADFLRGGGAEAGPEARRLARPEIRTPEDAGLAAAALTQRRAAAAAPVRLVTWLDPHLEPGMRLELADMPPEVPLGECRVRQLVSTVSPAGGAVSEVWASGQVAGPSSLLGDLLGALGGLL